MEDWLVGFRGGALAALTPTALAEYASAVAANLEEPPKRLTEEAGPMWSEIVQRRYRWDHGRLLRVHTRPNEPRPRPAPQPDPGGTMRTAWPPRRGS